MSAESGAVLFLTSAHPGGSGFIGAGESLSAASLRDLVAAGHAVHVVCFAKAHQRANPEIVALCASYRVFGQSTWQTMLGILRGWRWGSLLAPWFFTRSSPRNLDAVGRILREGKFTRIWIDFPSSLGFAPRIKNLPIDYFVHDVVAQKIARRAALAWLSGWVTATEQRLLRCCYQCHVLSEKDKALLLAAGYAGKVEVCPPQDIKAGIVDVERTAASIVGEFSSCDNLVFFGNMRRAENHWSLMHFLVFHFPKLRKACPDVRLWVLGLAPRRSLRWLARLIGGVEVVGAVDDPVPVYQAASLCIAPLRYGAGVKIKVLQMLDAGATVVATPVGAEGIASHERLIVAESSEFVSAVQRALMKQACQAAPSTAHAKHQGFEE
ncbi:glycosyltransferase [Bordetella sp. FB-8]|uniref:glycosyltransferase n=1 Tax=Bordetella sp. FB-8 TaxID=1159870 RepID=UPI000367F466|nr:glycosyltransferase [Bordetella sp. FB-8]